MAEHLGVPFPYDNGSWTGYFGSHIGFNTLFSFSRRLDTVLHKRYRLSAHFDQRGRKRFGQIEGA
jgi:hypothetical protein